MTFAPGFPHLACPVPLGSGRRGRGCGCRPQEAKGLSRLAVGNFGLSGCRRVKVVAGSDPEGLVQTPPSNGGVPDTQRASDLSRGSLGVTPSCGRRAV